MFHTSIGYQKPEFITREHQYHETALQKIEQGDLEEKTEKIEIEIIKKPASPGRLRNFEKRNFEFGTTEDCNNCPSNFSFEKQRLEFLGQAKVSQLREDGPMPDVNTNDPQIAVLREEQKNLILNAKADSINWGQTLKVIFVIFASLAILTTIFSMLYIFIMVVLSQDNLLNIAIPMIVNLGMSMLMIHLALKGVGLTKTMDSKSIIIFSFLKQSTFSVVILLVQLTVMTTVQSIPELIGESNNIYVSSRDPSADTKKGIGYFALGYLIVWGLCIIHLTEMGMAIVFTLLLKRSLAIVQMYELKQRTLPIGYQIFDKLQETQAKSHSTPYSV